MTVFTSTAYSRDLGDELRRVREAGTGMSGAALAVRLGWDPSKVSNLEHGKVRATDIDLVQLFTMCGKDIQYIDDFRRRYRYAFDEYVVHAPEDVRTARIGESAATSITSYSVTKLPSLVQTHEYADALHRLGGFTTGDRIAAAVQHRMDRQVVLRRNNPPKCLFYIHEFALQQRVGGRRVMEDQCARLLSEEHSVRVVPMRAVVPSSGCVLWEYEKAMPVVFSETELAQVFVQDPGAIARIRLVFDRLAEVALDEEQSLGKLGEYAGRRRAARDDQGPHAA
ncbi:helix-turn-helix transcriptional regulator [Lentzea sp. NPDC042327]|uniref:helix-turn-helix domain-containing protein n=1 Tax=Lentzea sp. NPDC042327 TaxID=3154801 RepID=UPI0033FE342D